ncbi:MAG: COQ9 family protein [Rhodospirillales bacterium]
MKDAILLAALVHVPFDGWTRTALRRGAADAGYGADASRRAFPGGLREWAGYFSDYADRRMIEALGGHDLSETRVRDKVTLAVRLRLEALAPHREAVRAAAAFLAIPVNVPLATRLTYRTVNAIWYAAGDTAADFNFYTKRGLLAAVYGATVLYWLNDTSEGGRDTWSFLDRRIGDVMKIPGYSARAKKFLERLPNPFGTLRALRKPLRRFDSGR